MTRGVVLFAFNSEKFNYYDMAEFTAKRINHFLNLPVTIITDTDSLPETSYNWDKIITVIPDKSNIREWGQWINKGRYTAFDLSPYDETIVLDVDYIINSNKLLKTFDIYEDFSCHNTAEFLMMPGSPVEMLSVSSYRSLWATVMVFKKTNRVHQIFKCLEMVQKNYTHYENIHRFIGSIYRNDYALTLALRIANGHGSSAQDYIPWNLLHLGKQIRVLPDTDNEFNTQYTLMTDVFKKNKSRTEYIKIKDIDFHLVNKELFWEIKN